MLAEDGGLRGHACGETVPAFGGLLDAVFADELVESGGDGCGPGCGALADLALGERLFGGGEHLDDALLGSFRLRRGLVGHWAPKAQGGPMLDGHDDLGVAAAKVEVAVAPGMQL